MKKSLGLCLLMMGVGCAHTSGPSKDVSPALDASAIQALEARADKAYDAEDFKGCAELRRQAAEAQTDSELRADGLYSAARCASLAADPSGAIALLRRAVADGFYAPDRLRYNPELASLHSAEGWSDVLAGASANLAKAEQPPMAVPVLRGIDVSHSRRATRDAVILAFGLELGKPIISSKHLFKKAGEALKKQFNLAEAEVSVIAFFAAEYKDQAFATVDLLDAEDAQRQRFLPQPTGHVEDPEGLLTQWRAYEDKSVSLMMGGAIEPEKMGICSVAHCMPSGFAHPELAPFEPVFIAKVPGAAERLLKVLKEDADPDRRSSVPFLLAYGGNAEQVVAWLVPFFRDPDWTVRNSVVRTVLEFQRASDHPLVSLPVAMDAMQMPKTTDRNKGTFLLGMVLEKMKPEELKARRAEVLRQVGAQLVEMAGYQQPIHREPAVEVLERLSGEKHEKAEQWKEWLSRQSY
ncbi:hypothetical protein JY651_03940 [Pyxidicoccus parkwayensis]|uniref:HEAT repeat domain-containing protein n=1 Tax=Pyxidicoccus parkwayensis TaxID=2813578 RepID=A0ABX7NZ65_9BACT|nr:hypothetical protein [Pyxidicoccus parkwaysis]QSQ24134.1 hypothetical protein JY651_03940 [Pyxidicoccus parkwaysis]